MSKPTLKLVLNRKQSAPLIPDQPIDWSARLKEEIAKKKKPKPDAWDNRIKCIQCIHLATNGACRNAKAVGAPGKYHPAADIPRRCDGYEGGGL